MSLKMVMHIWFSRQADKFKARGAGGRESLVLVYEVALKTVDPSILIPGLSQDLLVQCKDICTCVVLVQL